MHALARRLFAPPSPPLTPLDIIFWWERRRIAYNAYLAVVGGASMLLLFFFASRATHPDVGEDSIEPLALVAAPVFANIAFTGGWMVQLLLRVIFRDDSPGTGPTLLKAGWIISTIVVLLPTATWGLVWIGRLLRG